MYKDRIAPLYYEDPDFRSICEDYYACIFFLNKFKKEFTDNQGSIAEYEKTLKELEKELKARIEEKK